MENYIYLRTLRHTCKTHSILRTRWTKILLTQVQEQRTLQWSTSKRSILQTLTDNLGKWPLLYSTTASTKAELKQQRSHGHPDPLH